MSSKPIPPPPPPHLSISTYLRRHRLSHRHLKHLHAQIIRRSLHHDPFLLTDLISASFASGTVRYAARLFRSLPEPDVVLCNSMLKGFTQNHLPQLALSFYVTEFLELGFSPDGFTYPYLLKACAAASDAALGRQVHASVVKADGDAFALNSLVDMYFKCGLAEPALRVFRGIRRPDPATWNVMVSGFLNLGDVKSAMEVFDRMPYRDVVTYNTLMSAHMKNGDLEIARRLFEEMPERNHVSWNALISGLAQNGRNDEALSMFREMLDSGFKPDSTTVLAVVSACCGGTYLPDEDLITRIVSLAESSLNLVSVSTALLNMYAKFGEVEEARRIFDGIPEKDVVAWNAMIGGYAQNQRPADAVELFRLMQRECGDGVKADEQTMVSLVSSCGQLGVLSLGEWVHAFIEKNDIKSDIFLTTALIDMYAKCGDVDRSIELFQSMPVKDLASWNAMITGLAIHGRGGEALKLFSLMEANAIIPNSITFIGLLNACSHGGHTKEGLELFESMKARYGIVPRIEHYGCVVDLLGRARRLDEAHELVKSMPIEPDLVIWGALLGACRSQKNVRLAEEAASRLVELDPTHDGNYVLLSNVYASLGDWERVESVRAAMKANQVRKTPGCSSVNVGGVVYEFKAGDVSHPRAGEIFAAWDGIVERIKPLGYKVDTGVLMKNILEEEEREEAVHRHSEKLALAFALICLEGDESKVPVRIVKNLRICSDCHNAMECVSKVEGREIVVRDRNRFHHFTDGRCSCGGYW
ncbi:Pentatricopeptide repeat-containing protein [Acorus gramineus]|uniref:Pentatricopeptide repeat-containing protein n=1 Tax=Acorus gramineus TaxID=55184 RepID=A0AAV9BQQ3_ACOGR|nr:Pentatricopeptide repeat-containing protein [Acorus gramineus]